MIEKLIEDRVHPEDIAVILGRHPVAVRRMLPEGYDPKPRLKVPYGLTDKSASLRAKLGAIIAQMTLDGLSRAEIGEITGLNLRESCRAEQRPFKHDWTLSQIERTLAYGNSTGRRNEVLDIHAEDETRRISD